MVGVLLVLVGLSETVGRIVPLVVRRHRASRASVVRLVVAGTVVEALVFALWPLTAWTLAGLVLDRVPHGGAPTWTVGSLAPLLLTGILAFPLLGPALHLFVLALAGMALAGDLAAETGLGWWSALAAVGVAALVLTGLLRAVRRGVGAWGSVREPEWAL